MKIEYREGKAGVLLDYNERQAADVALSMSLYSRIQTCHKGNVALVLSYSQDVRILLNALEEYALLRGRVSEGNSPLVPLTTITSNQFVPPINPKTGARRKSSLRNKK